MVGKKKKWIYTCRTFNSGCDNSCTGAVAIPIFNSQLEKSRESTDLANIRAAYAEVMAETSSDGLDHKSELIKVNPFVKPIFLKN